MFHVVLVPAVVLLVIFCCCVPLPVAASVAASGLVWWLFVAYRNTLGAMSGVDLGRSGLLEGFGAMSPRIVFQGDDGSEGKSSGKTGLGGNGASPLQGSGAGASTRFSGAGASRRFSVAAGTGEFSGAAPSFRGAAPSLRGADDSSRNSSRNSRTDTFDDMFSPVSSPSVSVLSRSSYKENISFRSDDRKGSSPMLPPGSYPWLMPSPDSSIKKRNSLESVPVKIKLSKPTSRFLPTPDVTEEEPLKADPSKQIIQALKAMSRKRLHTTESEDSHEDSYDAVPKRRPTEFHHNLYASHLGSSDSSLHGIPEIQDDGVADLRTTNGLDPSPSTSLGSVPNNGASNVATPVSNKRPRAANDGGCQAAKRRNNEILSSLSSSLALLDPHIIRGRSAKRRESTAYEPAKKSKTRETHCVEVQTLPNPILKEDQAKNRQDKGTTTDRICEGSQASSRTTQNSCTTEKKVSEKMAAALLKSALMKMANSGELVTPDTSINSNSILSESSLSKSEVEEKSHQQKSVRFTLPSEIPKGTESALINGTSSTLNLTPGAKVDNVEKPSVPPPAFNLGSGSLQSTSASAVTSSSALVATAPSVPTTLSSVATSNVEKPKGFTLTSANSMAITPSPTDNSNLFSFGSSSSVPKSDSAPKMAANTAGPQLSASSPGFTFGAQATAEKPSFTFGAPNTPTSTAAPTAAGQKESTPLAVTSAAVLPTTTETKQSPFSFGQNTTSAPSQVLQSGGFKLGGSTMQPAVTSPSSGQSALPKPGGFSFTSSNKFSFGSSTTSATSTVATATITSVTTASATSAPPAQPAFSFGSSSFGTKPSESGSKSLFGMPPPPSTPTSSVAEPPKLFGGSGGFSFNATSNAQKPLFPAQTLQKPEEKKQEGFVFGGGLGQKSEASKSEGSRLLGFPSSVAPSDQAKPIAPAFAFGAASSNPPSFGASGASQSAFGASSGPQAAFGSFSSKPIETGGSASIFNPPATTSSSLFGPVASPATASGANSVVSFGSSTQKTSLGFGSPATTTAPNFGGFTMTATTSATSAPSFGTGLTSMASTAPTFGSSAPAFGQSTPAFGSSVMTFGSGSSGFSSTNPPTFGSVAGAPSQSATSTPVPTFGSGATSTPQFGSTFGSSSSVPGFGSTFGAAPALGASQTTTQQTAPAFGAPQTTTQQTLPAFGAPQTTTQQTAPAFGAQTTTSAFGAPQTTTQPTAPVFGALQTTTQPLAPAFGTQQTAAQSTPFSFSASTQPASPASGGFNFQAPGTPKPMFQFGATGTPSTPSAQQPFSFSGAPGATPGIGANFTSTMFSIGSGSAAPRSRTTLRTRKK